MPKRKRRRLQKDDEGRRRRGKHASLERKKHRCQFLDEVVDELDRIRRWDSRNALGSGKQDENYQFMSKAQECKLSLGLKYALMEGVTEQDLRVIAKRFIQKSKKGNINAARFVLDRVIGKPTPQPQKSVAEYEAMQHEEYRRIKAKASLYKLRDRTAKRRRLLTQELIEEFATFIREGLPVDGVCDVLSIPSSCFTQWFRTGQDCEDRDDDDLTEHEELCVSLLMEFRRANADYRIRLIHQTEEERQAMTALERRDRKSYGRDAHAEDDGQDVADPDERFL